MIFHIIFQEKIYNFASLSPISHLFSTEYNYFMRLNNPSQMRKGYEQVKNEQIFFKKSSNGPPFGSFSREK